MNKDSIIKIINKELTILQDIADGFANDSELHPMEIELALSKTTDIFNLFSLLKDKKENTEVKEVPEIAKNSIKVSANNVELENNAKKETTGSKEEIQAPTEPEASEEEAIANEIITEEPEPSKVEYNTENSEETLEETIEEPANTEQDTEIEEAIIEPIVTEEETAIEENEQTEIEIFETNTEETAKNKTAKSSILADQFKEQTISVNDMLSSFKKDKNLAALLKDRPVTDLKKAVKINDRIWYIKELFENNADSYNATIEKINKLPNLDEALSFIFKNFNWDQNKKSTVSFLELIYRRFAQIN